MVNTNSATPLREPQIAQFLDSVTFKMETIRSSETIHQFTQRNIPEHVVNTAGWTSTLAKILDYMTLKMGHYVLPKRQKPLSVDIALYPRRLESSSTTLCAKSRKRTWSTWLSRGRNLVLPKRREPLWFDKTLHPSRLTLLCDPVNTTVRDVQRNWLHKRSVLCCAKGRNTATYCLLVCDAV